MLKRRFSLQDDIEQSHRAFDKKQQEENESVAQFELSLRLLYREAWPGSDIKSADSDSALQKHFVNGLRNDGLQKYLRLHARSDNFTTTVEKVKLYSEANDLTETTIKKPVVRFANTTESNSDDTSTDKILSGIAKVLRAVEQKTPTPVSSSNASLTSENSASSRGSSNNGNGNDRNRNNRSNGRRNSSFRNPNSSSDQENRDPNVNSENQNFQSPPPGNSSYGRNGSPANNRDQRDRGRGFGGQGNFRGNPNNSNSSRGSRYNESNSRGYGPQNNGFNNNRFSRLQYYNRNFSGNSPRNGTPPRSPRPGCHVCGEVGCHTRLDEQGRPRFSAEGENRNSPLRSVSSPNPPARDATVMKSEEQHRCPICGRMRCTDPICINQM